MMKFFTRKLRRNKFLLPIVGSALLSLMLVWNVSPWYKKIDFGFVLQNTPYKDLYNAKCLLKDNRQWICPDIREQGLNKIRQSQLVSTRMLLIFDRLAKKYGLQYWITKGTLLGAARHKGHIPWDTDLDVLMPIDDYIEFLRKAVPELPARVTLQHHVLEHEYLRFLNKTQFNTHEKAVLAGLVKQPWNPRFRDDDSCFGNCLQEGCTWHDGLMIDIYPVSLSNGQCEYQFKFATWQHISKLLGYPTEYKAFPLKELEFEGFTIPVPNEWDQFLKVTYGSQYMNIPPVQRMRPPGDVIPDPLHSCSELKKRQSYNNKK